MTDVDMAVAMNSAEWEYLGDSRTWNEMREKLLYLKAGLSPVFSRAFPVS
jgi:hypothetical protein